MVTHNSILTASPRTITETNLSRVLSRLSTTILSPFTISTTSSSSTTYDELLHSHFARARFAGNLEYARTLLLRLEHDSSAIKIQSRKQAAQGGLVKQRALIKRIGDALKDVEKAGDEKWDYVDDDGEEGREDEEDDAGADEDEQEATRSSGGRGNKRRRKGGNGLLDEYDDDNHGNGDTSSSAAAAAAAAAAADNHQAQSKQRSTTEPLNVVRNRLLQSSPSNQPINNTRANHTSATDDDDDNTAITTGADAAITNNNPAGGTTMSTAQLLESSTSTQDALTTSLLTLAQRLKDSTQSFSTALETDTAHLNRAVDGLDKNTSGMDAATGRMGFLRRMSEGQGWWGRMMLYAWIAGLWLVAFLLVGVGPKLRF